MFRAKCFRFPIKPLVALEEKASEYPQKYHWNVTTREDPTQAQMSDRADLRRARPE